MISRPVCLGLALTTPACVMGQENSLDQLMSMSLEELSMLDVEMETASKVAQKLTDIPSSVYVLSNERIQRSGAKSIAEVLMLVPGLKVTKFNETSWFVSTRGFHDGLYNKMLVMMDGRSLFSPVYGGTYWSDVDYILADIERIEVLKGPGGTVWGGNAVNGVVNIITKSASDTQGTYISGLASNTDNYEISVRQGLSLNADVNARAFYKYREEPSYRSNESEKWKAQSAGMVFQPSDAEQHWSLRIGGEKSFYESELYSVQYDTSGTLVDYQAQTYGLELGATYKLTKDVTSYFSYAYSTLEGESKGNDPKSNPQNSVYYDIDNEHLATAQLMWNITDSWQFDVIGQYINVNYPDYWVAEDGTQYEWQSYPHEVTFDARLAWKKSQAAPLIELVVENIGKDNGYQAEMTSDKSVNQESVYVRVSHEF